MIPAEVAQSIAFAGFPIFILLTTTTWGRQKAERK